MPEETISIRKEGHAVVIDIPRDYFGKDRFGFWFRVGISCMILTALYFFAMPRVLTVFQALNGCPYIELIKYAAIIPVLGLFFLLHFMGFYISGDDGTSYFLSLSFYSPCIIASPDQITIVKRWFLRTRTISIPADRIRAFETAPWLKFVSINKTVIVCDGLKDIDGARVQDAINEVIKI